MYACTFYRIILYIAVNIIGSGTFVEVIVQGRTMARESNPPIGNWGIGDIGRTISCQVMPHDTATYRHQDTTDNVTLNWMALDNYGPVKFM